MVFAVFFAVGSDPIYIIIGFYLFSAQKRCAIVRHFLWLLVVFDLWLPNPDFEFHVMLPKQIRLKA